VLKHARWCWNCSAEVGWPNLAVNFFNVMMGCQIPGSIPLVLDDCKTPTSAGFSCFCMWDGEYLLATILPRNVLFHWVKWSCLISVTCFGREEQQKESKDDCRLGQDPTLAAGGNQIVLILQCSCEACDIPMLLDLDPWYVQNRYIQVTSIS